MSRLLALIDEYRDAHGQPSDASIARAIGIQPQTLNSWRKRGMKNPPSNVALRQLAALIGRDYETVVLRAVLIDIGWADEEAHDQDVQDSDGLPESETG